MRVEIVQAWPRRHVSRWLELPLGTTAAEAVLAANMEYDGHLVLAVYGERIDPAQVLRDGDRVELLRGLLIDPKEARRRRAKGRPLGDRTG
ncbi:MAG: RnfH family protein [Lysobacteraceae bacterium]|nr:MAG: RnfH family protein [Xanthomonadaceae bacterium]